MKQTIKLNESQLRGLINETINKVLLNEKLGQGAKKIEKIAAQHGGINQRWYRNGGGVGSSWGGYLSEIPEELILGVGQVDLHVYPHKNFEINGISSDDMDEIALNDGKYLYYDAKTFREIKKQDGRQQTRLDNDKIVDGAFKYTGKHTDDIRKHQWNSETTFTPSYVESIYKIKSIIRDINDLEKENNKMPYNIQDKIEAVKNALNDLIEVFEKAEENRTDNLPRRNDSIGSHYWRPDQPNNVQKFMKPRDSRKPNNGGRTDTYFDVQGGGIWGHDNQHPQRYSNNGRYAYA